MVKATGEGGAGMRESGRDGAGGRKDRMREEKGVEGTYFLLQPEFAQPQQSHRSKPVIRMHHHF